MPLTTIGQESFPKEIVFDSTFQIKDYWNIKVIAFLPSQEFNIRKKNELYKMMQEEYLSLKSTQAKCDSALNQLKLVDLNSRVFEEEKDTYILTLEGEIGMWKRADENLQKQLEEARKQGRNRAIGIGGGAFGIGIGIGILAVVL